MKSSVVRLLVAVVAASLMVVALPAPLATAAGPFQYHSLTPCRTVDTRTTNGPVLSDGVVRSFTIKGTCGVPNTATAVSINVTAVGPTAQGFLTLYPAGTAQPTVSNINYNAGEPALGNGAIVPLSAAVPPAHDLTVFPRAFPGGTVHMVIDVTGYFAP